MIELMECLMVHCLALVANGYQILHDSHVIN